MSSLLDIAIEKSVENSDASEGRSLIFVGSKEVGKTSLIQRCLDKNDPCRETFALEYCFGRKSGRSLTKDVCHVWELGGGISYKSLLRHAFGGDLLKSTLLLMVDLSSPSSLWLTLESILQTAHAALMTNLKIEEALKVARARFPGDHEDKDFITPFPIQLVIVGGKYDLFQILDPEVKKQIIRTLREVSHYLAATLIFYSDKDATLIKKMKDVINCYGFGGSPWKGVCLESNKPLAIPYGMDSFQQLQTSVTKLKQSSKVLSLDIFRLQFESRFPQESENVAMAEDPANDVTFREPLIDSLRSEKYNISLGSN